MRRLIIIGGGGGSGSNPEVASLLHFDGPHLGATFTDETGKAWTGAGAAITSTDQFKWGSASLRTGGGAGAYIDCTDVALAIGTQDFTMEGWLYRTGSSAACVVWDMRADLTNGLYPAVYHDASGNLHFFVNNADAITGSGGNLPLNTWVHVAVCRSGSSTRLFAGGVQTGSTYSDSSDYLFGKMRLGANAYDAGTLTNFNGYMDEFRLTIGLARYTSNFSPPAGPF